MKLSFAASPALPRSALLNPSSRSVPRHLLRIASLILVLMATVAYAAQPVITPIADQFTREGGILSIPLAATDADGHGISFSLSPTGAAGFCALTDNGNGTGSINCSPANGDGGSYDVTVTATDDSLAAEFSSVQFTLTVNSTPVLAGISNQSVVEAGTVNIPLSATDPDGDDLGFSFVTAPVAAQGFCSLTDNGNGTGSLNCSPLVGDAGAYTVTVTVTDDGTVPASASGAFTLTVDANQAPTASAVTISGTPALGALLTGSYSYDDAELDPEGVSTFRWLRDGSAIPGAIGTSYTVVVDDVEAALRFEVTPIALAGATPGTPVQSADFAIDNSIPVLSDITNQSVVEAGTLDIPLSATDPDGDILSFSFVSVPTDAESFCSLTDNGNGTGLLSCNPLVGNAGAYTVTVTVTDNGTVPASASDTFALTVAANQAPTASAVIISGTPALGALLTGSYAYADAELDPEGVSTFRWLRDGSAIPGAIGNTYTVVVDDVETALRFEVTPVAQAGATPGTPVQSADFAIDNSTPLLSDITDQSVVEAGTLGIPLGATDPDGDSLSFSFVSVPVDAQGFCALTDNGDGTGLLSCSPLVGDAGAYSVTVTVTDDGTVPASASDTFTLTVGANQPPTASAVSIVGVAALGEQLTGSYSYVDAELDPEGTSTFRWLRNGLAIPGAIGTSYTVVVDDVETALRFEVTPIAQSGATPGTPAQSVDLRIANSPPLLADITDQSIVEAGTLSIPLSATDPDGHSLSFSFAGAPNPIQAFCALTDNGNGTGVLRCDPSVGHSGNYTVTVTVTDNGIVPASASDTFALAIDANLVPTASAVTISGLPTFGELLTGNYTYADAEGDLEGITTFRWLRDDVGIPGATAATYTVTVDDVETSLRFEVTPVAVTGATTGTPVQSAPLLISNTAPSITGQIVIETPEETAYEVLLTDLTVIDLDSNNCLTTDDCTLTVLDDPDPDPVLGPEYTRGGIDGNTITPRLDLNGLVTVPVSVNDGFVDSAVFDLLVTVLPVNDPPVITGLVAPLSTPEDTSLTILVDHLVISDPDNAFPDDFTLTLQDGANYTWADNTVTPALDFNGQIDIPVTVSDLEKLPSPVFVITVDVTAENDLPVLLMPIGAQTAIESSLFQLDVFGNFSDADGDALSFSATGLPASGNITIDVLSGLISGTPDLQDTRDNDPYVVTVTAEDPSGAFTSDTFDLTVSALNRANLGLTIDVTPESALPSDQLRWTFTSNNPIGPAAGENVELNGSFVGNGLTVAVEGGANCTITIQGGGGRADFACAIGALPVGGTMPVVFTTTASQATEIVAFATTAGTQTVPIDPNIDDNSAVRAVGVAESFSLGAVQFLGNATVRSVSAGDFNADGIMDLVVGTSSGQPIQVFLGAAPRESCQCVRDFLVSPISIPDNGSNEGVALADFDGNGALDLVVANGGGQADVVYGNDGSGNFTLMAMLAPSDGRDVAVGDFNSDGNMDVAVAANSPNPVYYGNGNGGFSAPQLLGDAVSVSVAVGRFDANTRDDLVFANVGSDSQVWISDAVGALVAGQQLQFGDAAAVAVADLNADGRDDIVLGRVSTGVGDIPANPVLLNQGAGTFGAPAALLGISPTDEVLIGDVSEDGLPDIVFLNSSGVHQIWMAAGGGYVLHDEQIIDIGASAGVLTDLGFADTNDPGGVDLAMGGDLSAGLGVYLNDSTGNLGLGDSVPPVISLIGDAVVSVPSGTAYTDAGANALDNIDGDISNSIRVSGSVNTAVVGSYTLTYNVDDFADNPAVQVTRTVNVTAAVGRGGGGGGALGYWVLALLIAIHLSNLAWMQLRLQRCRIRTSEQ